LDPASPLLDIVILPCPRYTAPFPPLGRLTVVISECAFLWWMFSCYRLMFSFRLRSHFPLELMRATLLFRLVIVPPPLLSPSMLNPSCSLTSRSVSPFFIANGTGPVLMFPRRRPPRSHFGPSFYWFIGVCVCRQFISPLFPSTRDAHLRIPLVLCCEEMTTFYRCLFTPNLRSVIPGRLTPSPTPELSFVPFPHV